MLPASQNLVLAHLLLCASAGAADAIHTDSNWNLSRMTLSSGGETKSRGFALHTTDSDAPGAAFRCDNGKLYAVLSVKAMDLRRAMSERFRRPRDREVRVRINNGAEFTEPWVSLFGGRMYMARRIATISRLFRAAMDGGHVTLARGRGEPVAIDLPVGDRSTFDTFLRHCELRPANHPMAEVARAPESSDNR
jgi:hypothetical protein